VCRAETMAYAGVLGNDESSPIDDDRLGRACPISSSPLAGKTRSPEAQ
jgi:hypothetical protein